jgi:hypothetical protein
MADAMAAPEPEAVENKNADEYLNQIVNFDDHTPTGSCIAQQDVDKANGDISDKGDDAVENDEVGGAPGDMISFNDLVVLIVLYHGRIEGDIKSRRLLHPVIQSSDFPHIDNIANITLAPTGMVNIGSSVGELNTRANEIRIKLQDEIVKGFQLQIDEITRKTDEIIKPSTDLRSSSSRVCDYCIDFAYRASGRVAEVVSGLYGYTFQGMLRVCRSKLFPMSGGVLGDKRSRQALDPSSSSKRPATLNFKISPNLCVVIFDNVRRSIREDDCITFPAVCGSVCPPDEFCTQAARNVDSRCRILNLIKGFGGQGLIPFVDKYLIYSSKKDQPLNMGVVKLIFSIDANGNVTIKRKYYPALDLMEKINYAVVQTPGNPEKVYWSNMKPCIDYCTRFDPGSDIELNHNNLTVLSFDLTCSSLPISVSNPLELNSVATGLVTSLPGGGSVNKKNKSSSLRKKTNKIQRKRIRTRKIKNRSMNVKYLRNRRNVKILKRKTKKNKRTRRS